MRIKVLDETVYLDMVSVRPSVDFHRFINILTMKELNELERIFGTTILEIEPTIIRYTEALVITVTMNKPTTDTWKEYLIND